MSNPCSSERCACQACTCGPACKCGESCACKTPSTPKTAS